MRNVLILILILVSQTDRAIAQAPDPGREEGPRPARVEGTVRSATGEAIPRASLRLIRPNAQKGPALAQGAMTSTATSNADGTFVFEELPPGNLYLLSASRAGFVDAFYGARGPRTAGTPLNLRAGRTVRGIEVTMTPQAAIEGRVTDVVGDPLEGVQVQAFRYSYSRGQRSLLPAAADSTDDEGRYRLSGLAAGSYYLTAKPSRPQGPRTLEPEAAESPSLENVMTFYPNGDSIASAATVRVSSGVEMGGMDIRLLQRPTFRASGTVVGMTGAGAEAPVLRLVPLGGQEQGGAGMEQVAGRITARVRPEDGGFQFRGLAPGRYVLRSNASPNAFQRPGAGGIGSIEFAVTDRDVDDLVLPVGAGVSVTGRVSLNTGDISSLVPKQQAASVDSLLSDGPQVMLVASDTRVNSNAGAAVSRDGRFDVHGLSAGRYYVKVSGIPDSFYVKSARFNGQDVTHGELDPGSGGGGSLEIVLSDQAAQLTGVVQGLDGAAVEAAQVVLWPQTGDAIRIGRELLFSITDQNGVFALNGIAPGDYYLAGWDSPEAGLPQVPEFLMQFRQTAQKLEIQESDRRALSLDLIPEAEVDAARERLP